MLGPALTAGSAKRRRRGSHRIGKGVVGGLGRRHGLGKTLGAALAGIALGRCAKATLERIRRLGRKASLALAAWSRGRGHRGTEAGIGLTGRKAAGTLTARIRAGRMGRSLGRAE